MKIIIIVMLSLSLCQRYHYRFNVGIPRVAYIVASKPFMMASENAAVATNTCRAGKYMGIERARIRRRAQTNTCKRICRDTEKSTHFLPFSGRVGGESSLKPMKMKPSAEIFLELELRRIRILFYRFTIFFTQTSVFDRNCVDRTGELFRVIEMRV